MPWSEPPSGKPIWDQNEGDLLVGQYALLGITYLASDGKTVTSQVQFHGRTTKADNNGIVIDCEGKTWRGQTATLPPVLESFSAAKPGEYRLRSTGEVVKNPDLVASWTVTEPSKAN